VTAPVDTRPDSATAAANLIRFLETGLAPEGLFAPDVFADISMPQWRTQADTDLGVIAIRTEGHPSPGDVLVGRVEHTGHGFTLEFEERWDAEGQGWYCREMVRADVVGSTIVELAVYCTGDWDEARQREHAESVQLIRA
jgi:hypothetical protein